MRLGVRLSKFHCLIARASPSDNGPLKFFSIYTRACDCFQSPNEAREDIECLGKTFSKAFYKVLRFRGFFEEIYGRYSATVGIPCVQDRQVGRLW